MRREVRIGIFIGGAFLIFAVLVFVIGNLSRFFQPGGYPLVVHYDSVLGLDKSAAVRMVGIKVGYVRDIQLDLRRARVTLRIFARYQIPRGSKASQAAQGLLGEKYVEIQPSQETTFHQPGDELLAAATMGLDQLAPMLTSIGEEIKDFSQTLRSMLGEETKGGLQQSLQNMASLASELNSLVAENKGRFGRVLDGADRAVSGLDGQLQEVTATVGQASKELRDLVAENRSGIKDNLERLQRVLEKLDASLEDLRSTLDKVRRGEGTLGKLVNDPGLYDKAEGAVDDIKRLAGPVASLRGSLDFRGEYYASSGRLKSAFSLAAWSTRGPLVVGRIIHDPWRDRFLYTAQGGWRWANVAPRAGVIESSFGAGVDVYALRDRVVLSLEGFDFERASSPVVRAFARLYPLRNVFLVLGVNDFTLAHKSEIFFGLGLGVE
ncbi:MAG: MlaD family protein [Candidatus Aminicenantes bacterium]|nr:MlaD family protein [Candidatus Aminicenantes bacterium]